jgi:hypothetical protein
MKVIAGDVSRMTQPALVGEPIPDGVGLSLLVAPSLDLIGGSGNAPDEVGWKGPGRHRTQAAHIARREVGQMLAATFFSDPTRAPVAGSKK